MAALPAATPQVARAVTSAGWMRREERKRERVELDAGRAIAAADSRLAAFSFRRQVRKLGERKGKTFFSF